MPNIYGMAADAIRNIYDRRIHTPPILQAERYFPAAPSFTQSWEAIRDEALTIGGRMSSVPRFHELMKAQEPISANDSHDWRVFVLRAYGHDVPQNLERCPATAALMQKCPSVISASFSFLAPGKFIPPHKGPFRGILRFHLGLSMPQGADGKLGAVLWIDDKEHRLGNGDSLLWDDTYVHKVLNATDDVRIALLLDIWRTEMPADMAALSHLVVAGARMAAYFRNNAFSR